MSRNPNILILMADQLRADALGCYGNKVCRTPNLDLLAASGVTFEHAFTPNPICVPARASLTTGNYPHVATGHKGNSGRIREEQLKLAEHFRSFGYRTYACGKLHYTPYAPPGEPRLLHGFEQCDLTESGRVIEKFAPRGQMARGLEDYADYLEDVGWGGYTRAHGLGNNDVHPCPSPVPAEHHIDHWVADRTIARMDEHVTKDPDRPFLMFCSFPKPHSPYDPPLPWATMYDPRKVPPPVGDASMLQDRNPFMQHEYFTHAHDTLSAQARQVIKAYYYGLISHQDQQIGRVQSALERHGFSDNTIVIYTADHGELMGDFGTYFKNCFLDGSLRVPMLIRGPGINPNQRRQQMAGLQDILPTVASLSGCPLPQPVQGMNLAAILADPAAAGREVFYSQCRETPHQAAMACDERWKYCYSQWGGIEELYDLAKDPAELENLAARPTHRKQLELWRDRLVQEARRLGDVGLIGDGGRLVAPEPLERDALSKLPVSGMGWRPY